MKNLEAMSCLFGITNGFIDMWGWGIDYRKESDQAFFESKEEICLKFYWKDFVEKIKEIVFNFSCEISMDFH